MMSVRRVTLDGCQVAVIEVEPSDNPPAKFGGRVWIRVGPRRAIATAEEERRLVEKRRWEALPTTHMVSEAQPCRILICGVFNSSTFQRPSLQKRWRKSAYAGRPAPRTTTRAC